MQGTYAARCRGRVGFRTPVVTSSGASARPRFHVSQPSPEAGAGGEARLTIHRYKAPSPFPVPVPKVPVHSRLMSQQRPQSRSNARMHHHGSTAQSLAPKSRHVDDGLKHSCSTGSTSSQTQQLLVTHTCAHWAAGQANSATKIGSETRQRRPLLHPLGRQWTGHRKSAPLRRCLIIKQPSRKCRLPTTVSQTEQGALT